MRVGSLFAGVGGIDLGLQRAGMEIAFQVEIDPWCQKVLAKHWPDVPRYGDIRTVDWTAVPQVDMLAGGFPCQPHSVAGKRNGGSDERNLWPEFYRAICALRPRWALVENVPGLLSSDSGRFFGGILRDLAESGYDAEWESIPAAAVGAPQIRYRVYLVAYPNGQRRTPPVIFTEADHRACSPETSQGLWRGQLDRGASGGVWLCPEFGLHGLVDGLPEEVDRIRGLGNAVVPQVVEAIGRMIMAAEGEAAG